MPGGERPVRGRRDERSQSGDLSVGPGASDQVFQADICHQGTGDHGGQGQQPYPARPGEDGQEQGQSDPEPSLIAQGGDSCPEWGPEVLAQIVLDP